MNASDALLEAGDLCLIENAHETLDNYDRPASVDTRYQRISEDILREDHKQL